MRAQTARQMLPLHVEEHEARAMFSGAMTQKRVPLRVRWKPRGETKQVETRRPFAHAAAGTLFWVAEPCVLLQGKGFWEAMFHIDYGWSGREWTPRPSRVSRWKSTRYRPHEMPMALHRQQAKVIGTVSKPLVDISDADMAREAILDRARFLREYRETFGEEYAQLGSECAVVQFEVIKRQGAVDGLSGVQEVSP